MDLARVFHLEQCCLLILVYLTAVKRAGLTAGSMALNLYSAHLKALSKDCYLVERKAGTAARLLHWARMRDQM